MHAIAKKRDSQFARNWGPGVCCSSSPIRCGLAACGTRSWSYPRPGVVDYEPLSPHATHMAGSSSAGGSPMRRSMLPFYAAALTLCSLCCASSIHAQNGPGEKPRGLQKVNHIIVLMQENHSFDNYFGALAYAPNTPYHRPDLFDRNLDRDARGGCREGDHSCVDGL